MSEKKANIGSVKQVIGAVVDVAFVGDLPPIYTALEVIIPKERNKTKADQKLVLETQQHIGSGMVRTVAMGSTDGLKRSDEVTNTGEYISVPVGQETLGRIFNVLGEPVDGGLAAKTKKRYACLFIHI
jgi:F-type H+-transporting ATPase subunit beta